MDNRVIEEKFDSLVRWLERVRTKTPASVEILSTDVDAQDILSINLERAIQRAAWPTHSSPLQKRV